MAEKRWPLTAWLGLWSSKWSPQGVSPDETRRINKPCLWNSAFSRHPRSAVILSRIIFPKSGKLDFGYRFSTKSFDDEAKASSLGGRRGSMPFFGARESTKDGSLNPTFFLAYPGPLHLDLCQVFLLNFCVSHNTINSRSAGWANPDCRRKATRRGGNVTV